MIEEHKKKTNFSWLYWLVLIIIVAVLGCYFYNQFYAEPLDWGGDVEENDFFSWQEDFEEPIDPNLDPEEHKKIYEKVQKFVGFDVKYPSKMPQGFKLVSVDSNSGDNNYDLGGLSLRYEDNEGKYIEIIEGTGDLGQIYSYLQFYDTNKGNEFWMVDDGFGNKMLVLDKECDKNCYIIRASSDNKNVVLFDIVDYLKTTLE